jgi:hypothetical protein
MKVSRSAVSGWIKRGLIRTYPDGRLCPRESAEALLKSSNPARVRSALLKDAAVVADQLRQRVVELEARLADGDGESGPAVNLAGAHTEAYAEARAKRERFAAARAELEFERAAGNLVPLDEVTEAVGSAVVTLRIDLENLPARLAGRLIDLSEEEARELLCSEIERALERLSASFMSLAKEAGNRPNAPD